MIEGVNNLQKQIQTSMDELKTQLVVSEVELQSKESVNKIIKKYQARVSEMLKVIQKQKKQNEILKDQFKKLNQQLNTTISKIQSKTKVEQDVKNIDNRHEVVKKELEIQIKKNGMLKKQIDQIKYKEKYLEGHKVDDLKNQMKEKERNIQELNVKIKLYEKIDRWEKNGDSYKKQEELTQKIVKLNEEILHLKKKNIESKKNEQLLQKTIKSLREQITTFQTKLSSTKIQPKVQKNNRQKLQISQSQLQKLNEKFKQLQNAKKQNDKASRQQIQSLLLRIKAYERQISEIKEKVETKDKQSNILMFKLKERERKNFNTLEPIKTVRYSEEILHSSSIFETRKQYKGLAYSQGVYRQFDDSKFLPTEKNYRIKRIQLTYFEEHILSWTTQYEIIDSQSGKQASKTSKILSTFAIPAQYNNIKHLEYVFSDYQTIVNIHVYTHKFVEFIRITTSKEEVIEIGNIKNIPKCKEHHFEIKTHEKPICFLGVIESKKIGEINREYLINLGLQIRRKQVFLRSKTNRKVQSQIKTMLSQSHNDKNK